MNAAARLFTTKGFGATSTHDIAKAVGVAQATLYHYFAGKDAILEAILSGALRPGTEEVGKVEEACADLDQQVALYVLAALDIRMLADAPYNVAMLASLPEVVAADVADGYDSHREELRRAYARLARKVEREFRFGHPRVEGLGDQVLGMVETVVALRSRGVRVNEKVSTSIASSCLRLCGVHEAAVTFTVIAAGPVLDRLHAG